MYLPCSFSPGAPGSLINSILNIAIISLSNKKVRSGIPVLALPLVLIPVLPLLLVLEDNTHTLG